MGTRNLGVNEVESGYICIREVKGRLKPEKRMFSCDESRLLRWVRSRFGSEADCHIVSCLRSGTGQVQITDTAILKMMRRKGHV